MKISKLIRLLFILVFMLPSLATAKSYYTNQAAAFLQKSDSLRGLGHYYGEIALNADNAAYNSYIYSYLNSAYTNANYAYQFARYQYLSNLSTICYYAQSYAYSHQYYLNLAKNNAYHILLGYDTTGQLINNGRFASYYSSWANYYLYLCS